jgi:hypothetical protein
MQMQIAVSFRNAAWKIRAASSMTSPATLFHHPFEPGNSGTPSQSRLRLRVFRRDRYRCRGCGKDGDEVTLGLQPTHPAASSANEMLTLCARCQDLVRRSNITARDGSGFLPQLWRQLNSECGTQPTVVSRTFSTEVHDRNAGPSTPL